MAAIVAGIAALPGPAKAGFSVTFDVYDSSGTTLLSTSGPHTPSGTFIALSGLSVGQGVSVEGFTANFAATPGAQSITNVSTQLRNGDGVANRVVVTVVWDLFTLGSAGDLMAFNTFVDANTGTPAGLVNATGRVRTVVNDGVLTEDFAGSPSSPGGVVIPTSPGTGGNEGGLATFTRSGNASYEVTQYIYLDLGANSNANFTARSQVVVPAPAGLILAATALPFVGLLRRRLRKPEATTAA
jgi:hypothetical protein